MGNHFLVGEFIALGALDHTVEDEYGAVIGGFKEEDVLVRGFLVVEDVVDAEGHGLAGPHCGDFAEPAICVVDIGGVSKEVRRRIPTSVDGEGERGRPWKERRKVPLMVGWVISVIMLWKERRM